MTKFNMIEIISLPLDRSPLRRGAIAPRRFAAAPGPAHADRKTPGVIDELVAIVTTMLR